MSWEIIAVASVTVSLLAAVSSLLRARGAASKMQVKVGSVSVEFDAKTTPEQFDERLEKALANGKQTASAR